MVEEEARGLVRGDRNVEVEVLSGRDLDEHVVTVATRIYLQAVHVQVGEEARRRLHLQLAIEPPMIVSKGHARRKRCRDRGSHVVDQTHLDAVARLETPGRSRNPALVGEGQDLPVAELRRGAL